MDFLHLFLLLIRLGELKTKSWQHTELDWRELSFLNETKKIWKKLQWTYGKIWHLLWQAVWMKFLMQLLMEDLQLNPELSVWIVNCEQTGQGDVRVKFNRDQ